MTTDELKKQGRGGGNVTFDFQGYEVTGRLPRNAQAELGSPLSLSLELSEISLFDKETSFRI